MSVFGSFVAIYALLLSRILNLTLPKLFLLLKNNLYNPHCNGFAFGKIAIWETLGIFYTFIALVTLAVSISFIPHLSEASDNKKRIPYSQAIMLISIASLLLFSGLQEASRIDYLKKEKKLFAGKITYGEKIFFLKEMDQFIQGCRNILPHYHQGALLSDLNFNSKESPYMFFHRLLSYHLYPNISLRLENRAPNDVLVLFYKQNPLDHIPENYEILLSTEDQNYILAIKRHAIK